MPGRIEIDASVPEQLDGLVRYIGLWGSDRLYVVKTADNELIVKPRVQSKIDSVLVRNVTTAVWDRLRDQLNGGLEVIYAQAYSLSDDRQRGTAE